jgi:predicted DNA-binding transcriptional regulator YafY
MSALSKFITNKRLSQILVMLQKGRMISVRDTANKLNCSTRTINRALQTLKEQGHHFNYSTRFRKFKYHQNNHHGQHDQGEAENLKE